MHKSDVIMNEKDMNLKVSVVQEVQTNEEESDHNDGGMAVFSCKKTGCVKKRGGKKLDAVA